MAVAATLALMLLTSCALSDLRTRELLDAPADGEQREQRGRELLQAALEAVGGRAAYDYRAVELTLTDRWQGVIGWFFRPWPDNPTRLRMRYAADGSTQCELTAGNHLGERWGVDARGTWAQRPGLDRVYAGYEQARFILTAYRYFFELPLRVLEAPLIRYAGERERDGRRYSLVFATWQQLEPHAEHDQYLLWIAHDTQRIEMAQYTIRDKFSFALGVNRFSVARDVDGLVVPTDYWIAQSLDDTDFVHHVQLADVRFTR